MKTNNDVITLMNEFLEPIRQEKEAASGVTDEVTKQGTDQGAFGSEKQEDIKKASGETIPADSPEAQVKPGNGDKPVDDQGTKKLDSSEKLNQPSVKVNETDDPSKDNAMNEKEAVIRRNAYLAANIKAMLDVVAEEDALQKQASDENAEQELFLAAYARGIQKRAEDEAELQEAGYTPEQSEAILDEVAEANPAAVLPPEAEAAPPVEAPEGDGDGDPDDQAPVSDDADQLAQALHENGVTPDDLEQAAQVVKELGESGVAPEEIVAAVQNAAGEAPVPQDKVAAARMGVIQEHLGLLAQNR